eukprot:3008803-Prymnesium_polylepis.1
MLLAVTRARRDSSSAHQRTEQREGHARELARHRGALVLAGHLRPLRLVGFLLNRWALRLARPKDLGDRRQLPHRPEARRRADGGRRAPRCAGAVRLWRDRRRGVRLGAWLLNERL